MKATEIIIGMFLIFAFIFCFLWRTEIKERKKLETKIETVEWKIKNQENTTKFWAGQAINLDNMLRENLQVGLGNNRPVDFEAELEKKLKNCK